MATTQVETVSTGADKAKVGAAIALVIASLAAFYLLGKQGQLVQWAALIVGVIAAVAVFLTSESGKEFIGFGRDAVKETKKVVWPSRKETMVTTMVVFGFVIAAAAFFFLVDQMLSAVIKLVLGFGA